MTPAAERPHVLHVAWEFPPVAGGGAQRTLATANALVDHGCDVTVLTTTPESSTGAALVDPQLAERIDTAISVIRVPLARPDSNVDIRTWSAARIAAPGRWIKEFHETAQKDFPDQTYAPWLRPALEAAEEVNRRRPIDLTLASAGPQVALAIGHHLRAAHRVPHVMDYHDAWRLNCQLGTEAHADDPWVAELETTYMESASIIWFVNDAIREWHARTYPQAAANMRVVENGLDPDYVPLPDLSRARSGPPRFVFVGDIGVSMPVEEFIDGWVRARRTIPSMAEATADIYGPIAPFGGREHLARACGAYGLNFRGPVARCQVQSLIAGADALVLLLGPERFLRSRKALEYMASGLPIVSVHEAGNAAAGTLRGYPLWFPTPDTTSFGIAEALAAAAQAVDAPTEVREAASGFGRAFERRQQLDAPVAELVRLAREVVG